MDAKVLTKALNSLSNTDQTKVLAYITALHGQNNLDGKLLEKEAILNATIQSLPFDVWITDTTFRFIAVNKKTAKKLNQELGISAKPGHNFLAEIEAYSPEVAPFWRDILCRAVGGETIQKEYDLRSMNQCESTHFLEFIVAPYYDTDGKIIGCIGSTRDITEIKEQQLATLEREKVYKTIIEHARAGIDIIDVTDFNGEDYHTARLFDRNSKMEKYLQSEDKLFITKTEINTVFDQVQFQGQTSDQILDRLTKDLYEKRKSREIFRLKTKSGDYHDIDALLWVLRVNEKILFIRFFRDITNDLHHKQLIDNQIAELERYIESNIHLENFAYIAAHDLQAPIRSIAGYTGVLEKSLSNKLNDLEKQYLGYIISSAKNMQRLIGDLLDYSRANTQKRKLVKIDLNELKNEIEKNIKSDLLEHHVSLSWELSVETIFADYTKLRQILENLINNAIKFTPPNITPTVLVTMKNQADYWLFEVKDNGIGIEKKYFDQVFTIFRRLHGQDKYPGTGIGLALCKQLVEQHGGNIWLKSTVGSGSTFLFTIPKKL